MAPSVGPRNRARAITLLEVYECCLTYVSKQVLDIDRAQALAQLQRKHLVSPGLC